MCAAMLSLCLARSFFDKSVQGDFCSEISALHADTGPVRKLVSQLLAVGAQSSALINLTSVQLCSRLLLAPELVPRYADEVRISVRCVVMILFTCYPGDTVSSQSITTLQVLVAYISLHGARHECARWRSPTRHSAGGIICWSVVCGALTCAAMSPASGRCQLRKCHAASIQAALWKGTPKLRRTASVPTGEAEHHQTPASTMSIVRMLSLSLHVPTLNRHCRL